MKSLRKLRSQLRPGRVYRRQELIAWSNAVDRHLKQLVDQGVVTKLSGGLYYCPRQTAFGSVPPDDSVLVQAFLKDSRFLLMTPNVYNALQLGTTQLYNTTVVYNHKRRGEFQLGNRTFEFRIKPHFPKKLSEAFLLVDVADNLADLAEDGAAVLDAMRRKFSSGDVDLGAVRRALDKYGSLRARKRLEPLLSDVVVEAQAA